MSYIFETVIGNASALAFNFNGQVSIKNYDVEIVNGNRLKVVSTQNEMFSLLEADVSEVEINGIVYSDPLAAQFALKALVSSTNEPIVMTKEMFMQLSASVQAADRGKIMPDTPVPSGGWQPGWYTAGKFENEDPGTNYPNQNNLKAKKGFITKFLYNGVTWDEIAYPLPKASNNLRIWAAQDYDPDDQVIRDFVQYIAPNGASATDIPGESDKWIKLSLNTVDVVSIIDLVSNPKQSIVVSGAFQNESERNFTAQSQFKEITDINGLGIKKWNYATSVSNEVANYWIALKNTSGQPNGLAIEFESNKGKFLRITWFLYSKNGLLPTNLESNRVGMTIGTTAGNFSLIGSNTPNGAVEITPLDGDFFKIDKTILFDYPGDLNQVFIPTYLLPAQYPAGFSEGDFAISGLKIAFADTSEELNYNELKGDWDVDQVLLTEESADQRYVKIADLPAESVDYNNVVYNQSMIASFFERYINKRGDENNQVNIAVSGDSIHGGQNEAWGMDFTPDCNNANETQPGYLTGHFPPNMWAQTIAYKILKKLQYRDSDVKYFNHVSSEVTKTGTWSNAYPVGADSLRLCRTSETSASIQLAFTGAKFAKFLYSTYGGFGKTRRLELTISTDGGTTFKKIADAGLSCSIALDSDSAFYIPDENLKWGNVIISGLASGTSYILRVKKIDNVGTLDIWGFETWSNVRINVIVTAEGGSLAAAQVARPERLYHSMYNQHLIIYNTPYLNDYGTGIINNFYGNITLAQATIVGGNNYDFFRASETGLYANFNNLYLYQGDYLEWYNGAWRKGSTSIKNATDSYLSDNKIVYSRINQIGVPVLCLVTHDAASFASKPFTFDYALLLQRIMLKEFALPYIDVNRFFKLQNITNGFAADGTHLNNIGVDVYGDLVSQVLNTNTKFLGISAGKFQSEALYGSASGAGTINFGFEFSKTPKVRIFNNSSISITSKTKRGFTVTGSGDFEFEAFVQ